MEGTPRDPTPRATAQPSLVLGLLSQNKLPPCSPCVFQSRLNFEPWEGARATHSPCRWPWWICRTGPSRGPWSGRARALSRCWQGWEHWGSAPSDGHCSAGSEGSSRAGPSEGGPTGGGDSLIIHQPGMSECDLGCNQTRQGRHPVTRVGSCDLPFNYLPLSRGPVGTRGWSLSQVTTSRKSLAWACRDPWS